MKASYFAAFGLFIVMVAAIVVSVVFTLPEDNDDIVYVPIGSSTGVSSSSSVIPSSISSSRASSSSSMGVSSSSSSSGFPVPLRAFPFENDLIDLVAGYSLIPGSGATVNFVDSSPRGKAMQMGSDFIGVLPSAFTVSTFEHSICWWFKGGALGSNTQALFSAHNNLNTYTAFLYSYYANQFGAPLISVGYGNQGTTCSNSFFLQASTSADTTWNHYCMTIRSNGGVSGQPLQHTLYKNGIVASAGQLPGSENIQSAGGILDIGQSSCTDNLRGLLKGLAFFGESITEAHVISIYNKQNATTVLTLQTWS